MNELGEDSAFEHQKIGEMLDGVSLSWVVTVGEHANKFLAPAARLRGCQVYEAKNTIDAGTFVHKIMEQRCFGFILKALKVNLPRRLQKILLLNKDDRKMVGSSGRKMKKPKMTFLVASQKLLKMRFR